jgi:hypothetical protein
MIQKQIGGELLDPLLQVLPDVCRFLEQGSLVSTILGIGDLAQ